MAKTPPKRGTIGQRPADEPDDDEVERNGDESDVDQIAAPPKGKLPDYRLRLTYPDNTRTYITRRDGEVEYFSETDNPMSLSNFAGNKAAETRFRLEDAKNAEEAATIVSEVAGERDPAPKVEHAS
jgi:hypothetical protein